MLITIKSAKQKQSFPYQYSHALHISLYKNGNLQEFYISAVQFIIYKNKNLLKHLVLCETWIRVHAILSF